MNELSHLKPPAGATKPRKRVGRGIGSGNGKTAGRGHKGQRSRSGGRMGAWFEGGQMPLQRRVPKRGFTNVHAEKWVSVNVHALNRFEDGAVIDVQTLRDAGLVKNHQGPVKLLGHGTLERKVTVKVDAASKSALEKVQAAGGHVEVGSGE